jgi:hypothetical protein
MMHAEHWNGVTALAAIFFVAAAGRTAFADETLAGVSIRATPPAVQQAQRPQEIQVVPPPLPSCPNGWPYSQFLFDYCHRPRGPLNPPGY